MLLLTPFTPPPAALVVLLLLGALPPPPTVPNVGRRMLVANAVATADAAALEEAEEERPMERLVKSPPPAYSTARMEAIGVYVSATGGVASSPRARKVEDRAVLLLLLAPLPTMLRPSAAAVTALTPVDGCRLEPPCCGCDCGCCCDCSAPAVGCGFCTFVGKDLRSGDAEVLPPLARA